MGHPPEAAPLPPAPAPPRWLDRQSPGRLAWLAAVVGFLAYLGAVPGGFVFDDDHAILNNPVVRGQVPPWQAFVRDFWGKLPGAVDPAGTYRPLVVLSFALEWWLGGGKPWLMHLGNALWHAATLACLVLAFGPLVGWRLAAGLAALATLMAAPGEAVQAIVGRADLMSACFVLLALRLHQKEGPAAAGGAALALGVALSSKESAIGALPAFWLLDRLLRGRTRWRRLLLYGLVAASYLALRGVALGSALFRPSDPQSNPLLTAEPLPRLLGAGRILVERYLAGLLDPGRRLYECSAWACGPARPDDLVAWLGLGLALLLAASPLLLWRKAPVAAAGLGWFCCFFLPVSNLLVLGPTLYGERLLYLPLFGLELALLVGLQGLARHTRPALAWTLGGGLALLNGLGLQARHLDWRDEPALFASALPLAPGSAKVQQNLAVVAFKARDWPAAEQHAARAMELWPDPSRSLPLQALAVEQQGQPGRAEALLRQGMAAGAPGRLVCTYASFLVRQGRAPEAVSLLTGHLDQARQACPGTVSQLVRRKPSRDFK